MSSLTDYQDTLLASSPALAFALANAYEMGRGPQPNYQPSAADLEARLDGAINEDIMFEFARKENPSRVDSFQNPETYGSNQRLEDGAYRINYNPEAHPAYLAHEMGHAAAQQSQPGKFIHNLRTGNFGEGEERKLYQRMAKYGPGIDIGMAGALAALTPGDDDLAASILGSYASSVPQIADELMASIEADKILRKSNGGKMMAGSRARLISALGGYAATPLLTGAVANYAGNLVDDEIVGPPSNTANVA